MRLPNPPGHRVLIGEQPVVGGKFQLPHPGAGMTDYGCTEAAGITGRNTACEEYPRVSAVTRAGNFQRRRHTQFVAGLDESLRILSPLGLVEIHR